MLSAKKIKDLLDQLAGVYESLASILQGIGQHADAMRSRPAELHHAIQSVTPRAESSLKTFKDVLTELQEAHLVAEKAKEPSSHAAHPKKDD